MLPGITPALMASAALTVEALLVAGGGGGGGRPNSGGTGTGASGAGAGGVQHFAAKVLTPGAYAVVVGNGGTGARAGVASLNGGNTTVTGFAASIGGGRGGFYDVTLGYVAAGNGGSGGGQEWTGAAGLGTAGQGFNGGAYLAGGIYPGGGGGGAGGVGGDASSVAGGNGGPGVSWSTSGAAVVYACGGIGNSLPGGAGGTQASGYGFPGCGGHAREDGVNGNDGIAGIVIFQYAGATLRASGGTITHVGGNTQHTFTSNGTFTVVG